MEIRAANDRAEMHGFAGAIDAALGEDERFVPVAQVRAAGRGGVGIVKLAAAKIEPGEIAFAAIGDQRRRRLSPGAGLMLAIVARPFSSVVAMPSN